MTTPTAEESRALTITDEDREWIDSRADELFRESEIRRGGVRPTTTMPQDYRDYFVVQAAWERFDALTQKPIEWSPISTAPKDGTAIQARIPGHGIDNIIAWTNGLVDEDENEGGGWYFVEDQEPPDCWTDGVCWASNDEGNPSIEPTHWKALPLTKETPDADE